jgi:protoheme IX farnesyltransferase
MFSSYKNQLKMLKDFYKSSIVVFVAISAVAGYLVALPFSTSFAETFSLAHFLLSLTAVILLSSGSLGLNQVQESHRDALMERTKTRPIPSGLMTRLQGLFLALGPLVMGLILLWFLSHEALAVGLVIVILYNIFYTYWWKPTLLFGAVPGAIPGALPATLGLVLAGGSTFSRESLYLFLVMFLWQMPHYWTLAIKLKDDYARADFPILPVFVGKERTIYHISFYVVAYGFLALSSPFFVSFSYAYFFIVIPLALKIVYEFWRFAWDQKSSWLRFFLWTNFSLLLFLFAPVVDRWYPYLFLTR